MALVRAPLLLWLAVSAFAQQFSDFRTPLPLHPGSTLVIGFLGGFEGWNDPHRGVRQTALRLRELPGLSVETIENHRKRLAVGLVRKAFDFNRDGVLDAGEAAQARVILYGQSLGGSAAIWCARRLAKLNVPVALTVQVDSVGLGDGVIPANVRTAANLYQHERFTIRGRQRIRAADPTRTTILANQRYEYPMWFPGVEPESWPRRTLGGAHARMEADPVVWLHVQSLILHALGRGLFSAPAVTPP